MKVPDCNKPSTLLICPSLIPICCCNPASSSSATWTSKHSSFCRLLACSNILFKVPIWECKMQSTFCNLAWRALRVWELEKLMGKSSGFEEPNFEAATSRDWKWIVILTLRTIYVFRSRLTIFCWLSSRKLMYHRQFFSVETKISKCQSTWW